jgi:NAD(P)H dehydrogenase (quinone)
MIAVTGATGQLGQLVMQGLLRKQPAAQVVAAVRNPQKAAALAAQGVQVRAATMASRRNWSVPSPACARCC